MAFEYDLNWLRNGFSISPFKLPLEKKVFIANKEPFGGVFGIFNDSLPDTWGQLLVNRELQRRGIAPNSISVLDRLSIVGKNGLGALEFEPSEDFFIQDQNLDLEIISKNINKIINDTESIKEDKITEELFRIAGSSGGTRPKIFRKIKGSDWIIKFRANSDPKNIGQQEFDIMKKASKAGLIVPEHQLFNGKYFGVRRFDRTENNKKVFMISASGLLDADYKQPVLDYSDLINLTAKLTRNTVETQKMFRLMVFNVLINNTDDHAKNFAFLYNGSNWYVSPAFDLTRSQGIWEHTTSVIGKGLGILNEDMIKLGEFVGINRNHCEEIISEVKNALN